MNSESTRTQASQQYFELRNKLNQANRTKNLKTELEFVLRENDEEYFIILKSTGAEHGLRIAFKTKMTSARWFLVENEIYNDFLKYMYLKISCLNPNDELSLNQVLAGWLLRLWMS